MTRLYSQYRPRVILVNVVLSALLLAVVAKLFMVQVYHHDDYHRQAALQSTRKEVLAAVRGRIVDRHGEPLTANITHYSFAVDPQVLEDPIALADRLARTFQRPAERYLKLMDTDRSFVWLERDVTRAQCEELLAFIPKGLIVRSEMRRRYPYSHIAAQIIGFTDVDNKGIAGIELVYDQLLRGEDGSQLLRRDAKGGVLPYPGDQPDRARHGDQVRLTIDIDYQSIFQEEMALAYERLAPQAIHGVMMDPQTGEILAMAQYPGFDPHHPAESPSASRRLLAITDLYEPGSTLKVITATAVIEEGIYTPTDVLDVENGEFAYYNLTIRDTEPRSRLSLSEIIAYSSNIGIIKIAETLGADLLYRYGKRFGLGARTGVVLSGESPGLLKAASAWSRVSTGEIAMGHEIGVTTLQLAVIYSAIANGGLLLRPALVLQVGRADEPELLEHRPEVIRRVASPATMEQLRRMLTRAVEEGTGVSARIPGYTLAGKTGTAQKFIDGKYSNIKYVATFAAMIPADRPRLVCVVAVDSPSYGKHFGSIAAAPIVRNTFKRILHMDDNFYVPPQAPQVKTKVGSLAPYLLATAGHVSAISEPGRMPDFRGFSLRKALKMAKKVNVRLQLQGSGRVVEQSIKPGTRVDHATVCLITLVAGG